MSSAGPDTDGKPIIDVGVAGYGAVVTCNILWTLLFSGEIKNIKIIYSISLYKYS